MKHEIFTVYDSKAEAYIAPFFLPMVGQAKRTFGECCNSSDHAFGRSPQDYTLFHLGNFDDANSKIDASATGTGNAISLGNGLEYVTPLSFTPPMSPDGNKIEKRNGSSVQSSPEG
nr:MAG: nonstructural protein [Microvirus sp.]